MTDNEIIKFMQCVMGNDANCSECEYQKTLPFPSCRRMCAKNALDLINRQKAEIERLEKEIKDKERAYNDEFCSRKEWQTKCRELLKEKQITKSEAIKDFAERLKEGIQENHYYTSTEDMGNRKRYVHITNIKDFSQYIDNLVKEMTEVNKNDRA